MNKLRKITLVVTLCFLQIIIFAQENNVMNDEAKKAARMQQSIYIVMAVALTIMLGLILYVFSLDRKITKLEKMSNE